MNYSKMLRYLYDMVYKMYTFVRDSEIWEYNLHSGLKWEEHVS